MSLWIVVWRVITTWYPSLYQVCESSKGSSLANLEGPEDGSLWNLRGLRSWKAAESPWRAGRVCQGGCLPGVDRASNTEAHTGSPCSLCGPNSSYQVFDIGLENYFQNSVPTINALLSDLLILWHSYSITSCPQIIPNTTWPKKSLLPKLFPGSFNIITIHLIA